MAEGLDLRKNISLGIENMLNTLDERRGFIPFFEYQLVKKPVHVCHNAWDIPHVPGRYLDAMWLCHGIVDTPDDSLEVLAMQRQLHSCIGEDGLVYNRPTVMSSSFMDEYFPQGSHSGPPYTGDNGCFTHHFREAILGLIGLVRWRGDEKSRKLAQRLCLGVERVTRETGGFPGPYYSAEKGWIKRPEDFWHGSPGDAGRLIQGLNEYFRLTGDTLGIELAMRLAEYVLSNAFDEEGKVTKEGAPHVHSITGTTTGIIDLGLLINDRNIIERGKRIFDVGLVPLRSSYGWVKEWVPSEYYKGSYGDGGEVDGVGDLAAAALRLGIAGYPEYFEDTERIVRNQLVASQLVDISWIEESKDKEDTWNVVYSDVARRAKGGFGFCSPNDWAAPEDHTRHPEMCADLVAAAVRPLCEVWRFIATQDEVGIHLNLLLTVETDFVKVKSEMPYNGKITITPLKDTNLFIRVPSWCDRSELSVTKNGVRIPIILEKSYMVIWNVRHSENIELSFPLAKQTIKETINGKNYIVEWLGDTVMSISPRGSLRPLYTDRQL